jgi:hypothetical protein
MSMQDGIRAVQHAFGQAGQPLRWPLYVRQAKQYLRNAVEGFDERKYGFASVVDLLRAAGKEGVLRIERDRQGAVRVFPGPNLAGRPAAAAGSDEAAQSQPVDLDETVDVEVPAERITDVVEGEAVVMEAISESPIVDAEPVESDGAGPKKATRTRKAASARAPKAAKPARTAKPRARKASRAPVSGD